MSPDARSATVVVGYDGSAPARRAAAHAVWLAGGGRIVLVHVQEATPPRATSRWRELLDADREAGRRAMLDAAPEEVPALSDADWEARLVSGAPAQAIIEAAREARADAIVVGSRGFVSGTDRLGSVSAELLRHADRPVTVIPPGAVGDR
jgi:nucleotide-binding universal stress UspA family protein